MKKLILVMLAVIMSQLVCSAKSECLNMEGRATRVLTYKKIEIGSQVAQITKPYVINLEYNFYEGYDYIRLSIGKECEILDTWPMGVQLTAGFGTIIYARNYHACDLAENRACQITLMIEDNAYCKRELIGVVLYYPAEPGKSEMKITYYLDEDEL